MKTLIIFSLVVFISSSFPTYKCPDDKIKIGENVCAIAISDKDGNSVTYIKKKCGKKQECKNSGGSYYNKVTTKKDYIYTCQIN